MMNAIILTTIWAIATAAQPDAGQRPPPPELVAAGEAFTACLHNGVEGVQNGVDARMAARRILAACNDQQQRLITAHERWLDSSPRSEAARRIAREETIASVAGLETQLVQAIEAKREGD